MNSDISPELKVVSDFLQPLMPFNSLPADDFRGLIRNINIQYFTQGQQVTHRSSDDGLRIIRSGAVDIRNRQGQLLDRLGEGESFNLSGLTQEDPGIVATFIEDSLVYFLGRDHYQAMRQKHRPFDRFFHGQRSRRLSRALRSMTDQSVMARPITGIMTKAVFCVTPDISVQSLAQQMTERRISSALVTENDQLTGIVTDRDLRTRVIAKGLPPTTPAKDIMTRSPVGLPEDATHFDALLLMTRHGYHHLPVFQSEGDENTEAKTEVKKVAGILTASDLMLARQDDPVYLVQHISRQPSPESLASCLQQVPQLFVQWVNAGLPAFQITHILTAISDAVTNRLIELAIEKLGPAPVPFAWLAFGSQARGEQLLNADQDNGLLIANDYKESHRPWFSALAKFVCDGLNTCGYDYCPGGVMATTEAWCQPLSQWKKTVDHWVNTPTPDAVMRVSIFFDLRCLYGPAELCRQLQGHMLERTQKSTIFQAALAANVLDSTPPLGIFRRFVVERNGEHRDQLDLKKRGIIPVVDMARLHALAHGIDAINTMERLKLLARTKHLTKTDSRNLNDALAFMMQVRVNNHVRQINAGEPPDNYCNPNNLAKLAKEQLRDAFTLIHDSQHAIKQRYRQGMDS